MKENAVKGVAEKDAVVAAPMNLHPMLPAMKEDAEIDVLVAASKYTDPLPVALKKKE